MKYEISDIINDKYIYGLTVLRIHNKVNKNVIYKILFKFLIKNSILIHLLFLIFNSMGMIVLCSDFVDDYDNNLYLSKYLRILTPIFLIETFHIDNLTYIIICSILIIICILRCSYLFYLMYKTKNFQIPEIYNIKVNIIVNIINHLVYIFFSYIIEFYSFIFYIELFPEKFTIKKNKALNHNLNIVILVLNSLCIIIYNCINFQLVSLVNTPNAGQDYYFRMRIPKIKYFILNVFENFSLLQPLPLLLNKAQLKIWNISFSSVSIVLLILIYIISFKSFNYTTILNQSLSFIGEFCFTSLIIEIFLYILSSNYNNSKQLISFTIIKFIITICLFYGLDIIYNEIMIREIKKGLFLKESNNYTYDKNISNYILYIKEIIIKSNKTILVKIIKLLYDHQNFCVNKYCGCKIIKIISDNVPDLNKNLDDFLKQINYYIETILIKFNFNNDFEFAILLSEHFFLIKKNTIMAYSVLQTLLHNNYKTLSVNNLLVIYITLNKYIYHSLKEKMIKKNLEKFNDNKKELLKENKEYELKQYFNYLLKNKKIVKLMKQYSISFNEIIKYKQIYENSLQIDIDETDGEIIKINSTLLTNSFITDILELLRVETEQTNDLKKYLSDLKEYSAILPCEFLFKCFLFIDYFWNAKIPNELKDILFGFSSNRNLYTNNITQEIYDILEDKYNEKYINYNFKYYLMLKYTKGLIISYLSETLLRKLNLVKDDINNKEINVLFINDLIIPHNNAVNQYFMLKQNHIIKEKKIHIFNRQKYMIECIMNSTFQIGLNKNILVICVIQLNENNNEVFFFINKNLEIISISQTFYEKFNISLGLIDEFKIELKDLFDIYKHNINKKYKKEFEKVKEIKQYIQLDPKEYVLKNIFKAKNAKENFLNYHDNILNEMNQNEEEEEDNEEEEKTQLKSKKVKDKFYQMIYKIYDNQNADVIFPKSINFRIEKNVVINKIKKMIDKISLYERGKLETKNIYEDYLRFNLKYNEICTFNNNISYNLNIKLKFLYDTTFYLCKVEKFQNNIFIPEEFNILEKKKYSKEIKKDFSTPVTFKKIEKHNNYNEENDKRKKSNDKIEINDDWTKDNNNKLLNEREKIKTNKISKKILGFILISLIFILLIIYIIILIYQMNLITQGDKIFKTLYYTYYQKAQLLYIYSVILSIHFNLLNLTDTNLLKENQEILLSFGKNFEEGFHLFYQYYMDYRSGVGEDVKELYEPKEINQITINWENIISYSDYIQEMQIILYRTFDVAYSINFTQGDKDDCDYLLLEKYKYNNNDYNKKIETHGNLIRLIYYIIFNYDAVWAKFYDDLTNSFEDSFNKFSNKTVLSYLLLEVFGIIIYIIFFGINFLFLYKSNKYIFHSIICIFIDFTQKIKYTFNFLLIKLIIY